MNKLVSSIGVFTLMTCIAACSTSNQPQNEAAGGIAGGITGGLIGSTIGGGTGTLVAVGAGTLLGALIGGSMGRSMDRTDRINVNRALDCPSCETQWTNTRTGTAYTVVTTNAVTINGNKNCRRFYTISYQHGKKIKTNGVACPTASGEWQVVR